MPLMTEPLAPSTTITREQYKKAYRAYYNYGTATCAALEQNHPNLNLICDRIVALNVAIATYDDIDRFKSYHLRHKGDARSDSVKRAAYFAKWTSKLRPIMFTRNRNPAPANDLGLLVNEILAVSYALELISEEINRDITLSAKTHANLLYDLHYRDISDDALLSLFQIVSDLARAGEKNCIVEFSIA